MDIANKRKTKERALLVFIIIVIGSFELNINQLKISTIYGGMKFYFFLGSRVFKVCIILLN